MIEIDGSFGEGGGQILRTALALSAVTKKPCHIFNIRRNRPKPGLKYQHLLGLKALVNLCNSRVDGDFLNSREVKFWPDNIYRDRVSVNIPTAGSITLVLQTLVLPSLFADSPVKIYFEGGATDTFFSPTIDHFYYVFLEIAKKLGANIKLNIRKRGYYPEGGAEVEAEIFPSKLKSIALLDKGKLQKILIFSGASELLKEKKVAERQLFGVREILGKLNLPAEEKIDYYDTDCPGSNICLIAQFENTVIGVDNLGKLGKRAEDVGKEAALNLLKEEKSQACLDKYSTDQILPYLALAKGDSEISVSEITNHCKTNIWAIKKFVKGNFEVKENIRTWKPT